MCVCVCRRACVRVQACVRVCVHSCVCSWTLVLTMFCALLCNGLHAPIWRDSILLPLLVCFNKLGHRLLFDCYSTPVDRTCDADVPGIPFKSFVDSRLLSTLNTHDS